MLQTYIGDILVAINPFKSIPLYNEKVCAPCAYEDSSVACFHRHYPSCRSFNEINGSKASIGLSTICILIPRLVFYVMWVMADVHWPADSPFLFACEFTKFMLCNEKLHAMCASKELLSRFAQSRMPTVLVFFIGGRMKRVEAIEYVLQTV